MGRAVEEPREALNDAIVCSRLRLLGINRVWTRTRDLTLVPSTLDVPTKVLLGYTRIDLEIPCPDMLPKLGGDFVNNRKKARDLCFVGEASAPEPLFAHLAVQGWGSYNWRNS